MYPALALIGAALAGYLIGGIPFGYLVAWHKAGIDIRQHGSGNIGATNVGRVLGRRYFAIVFALDFLKGAIPVALAAFAESTFNLEQLPLREVAGLAAILGHMFPVYLRFRGGKGVATTIGVLAVLALWSALAGLAAFLLLLIGWRMVSVGSIGFALAFAVAHFIFTDDPFAARNLPMTVIVVLVAVLVIVRHRGNIGRVFAGTEPKVKMPWTKQS